MHRYMTEQAQIGHRTYLKWVQIIISITLNHITPVKFFLLDTDFKKSIIRLDFFIYYTLQACEISR